jgi:AraC-like DNA-binding protein
VKLHYNKTTINDERKRGTFMLEQIFKQHDDLARIIEHHTGMDGIYETEIPSLFLIRQSAGNTEPRYRVYKPSLCIVIQGVKQVSYGMECFRYGPEDYLITSVDLPVTGRIIEASSENPYLAIKLEFTPSQILEVLNDAGIPSGSKEDAKRGMFISRLELSLLDAVIRLVRLLDNPKDIPVLVPLFTKEVLYRILQGEHGGTLEQIVIEGSSTYQIGNVIQQIINNYDKSLKIKELAEIANMSVSSLHRHFKEVTAMSPIQFQKQLRLQEARRLLLSEATDATDVAYRVGYESPSQFSREYSRIFGFPPIEDTKRFREKYDQTINA